MGRVNSNGSVSNSASKRNNLRNLYLSDDEDDIKNKENPLIDKEYNNDEEEIEMEEIDNRLKKLEMILSNK